MRKYEITRDKIIELALKSDKASIWLQQNFKDAFKNPLEKGKWYIDKYKRLFVPVEIIDNANCLGYGFGCIHSEFINLNKSAWEINGSEELANEQDVFEALKNEAVKRGYKEKDIITDIYYSGYCTLNQNGFEYNKRALWMGDCVLFQNGQWAEIIPTITRAEAEKQLGIKIID